MKPTV